MGTTEKLFKGLIGLILIVASIYSLAAWWWGDFLTLVKGALPVLVFLIGLVFLLLSFEK